MLISDTVRAKRRQKEISQDNFASQVGITRVRYIAFEKGRGKVTEAELLRICSEIGIEITLNDKP